MEDQLLEDLGKGLKCLHMRSRALVKWTIVANNGCGHTSNSCLHVLINTLPCR